MRTKQNIIQKKYVLSSCLYTFSNNMNEISLFKANCFGKIKQQQCCSNRRRQKSVYTKKKININLERSFAATHFLLF